MILYGLIISNKVSLNFKFDGLFNKKKLIGAF